MTESRFGLASWRRLVTSTIVCLVLSGIGRAEATGFFINQQSITGLGRADAGNVAAANDPATVFFNPAGMTELFQGADDGRDTIASFGGALIIARSDLDNDGSTAATLGSLGTVLPYPGPDATNPSDPQLVPSFYALQRLFEGRAFVGLGLTSPFGLSGKFDRDWFGRYDSIESELKTINIGPVIAIPVGDYFSIGAGFDAQYADSTLSSAIPNPLAPGGVSPQTDGFFEAKGDDWSFGYNVGALVKLPHSGLQFGVHFRSEIDHEINGTAKTEGLTGPLAVFNGSVGASAASDLPAILSSGIAFAAIRDEEVGDRLTLYGDFSYFWWSDAKEARIKFDDGRDDSVRQTNFRDTYATGIGADYRWDKHLTLRAGFRFDRTPTVDRFRDTTFADANRYWAGIGASYDFRTWLSADLALVHVFEDSTEVDVERRFFEGTPLLSTVRVKADVQSSVTTIAFNARMRF